MTKIFFKSSPISPNHLYGNCHQLMAAFSASPVTRSLGALKHMHDVQFFSGCSEVPVAYLSPTSSTLVKWRIQKVKSLSRKGLNKPQCSGTPLPTTGRAPMLSPRAGYRAGNRPCPVSQGLSWLLEQWDPSGSLLRCQSALGVHHVFYADLFYGLKESTGRDSLAHQGSTPQIQERKPPEPSFCLDVPRSCKFHLHEERHPSPGRRGSTWKLASLASTFWRVQAESAPPLGRQTPTTKVKTFTDS